MKFFLAFIVALATFSIVNSRSIHSENPRTEKDDTVAAETSPKTIDGSLSSFIEQKLAEAGLTEEVSEEGRQKRSSRRHPARHQKKTRGHNKPKHNMSAFFYVPPNGK
ncbi:hypothetical protein ACHWQZ_G014315 [Mnemiopsis leidyi]